MTLLEIKTAVVNYFSSTTLMSSGSPLALGDLTQNSQDLFLVAANQVRRTQEMSYDYEFTRKLATLTVNGVTGGVLSNAVAYGTSTPIQIKSIIEVGMFDSVGNLRPVTWTTVAESLERQRTNNKGGLFSRYPTDADLHSTARGEGRFDFAGSTVFRWPKDTTNNYSIGMEVYSVSDDWGVNDLAVATIAVVGVTGVTGVNDTYYQHGTLNGFPFYINVADSGTPPAVPYFIWNNGTTWIISPGDQVTLTPTNYLSLTSTSQSPVGSYTGHGTFTGTSILALGVDITSTSNIWTTYGSQYLQWAVIIQLNHLFKSYVFRQEGNLPPPEKLAAEGLDAFREWDTGRFETFRRHGR